MNIKAEIQRLLSEIGRGKMCNSPYDAAWIARLKEIDSEMGNSALEWICENQLPDGSWGTLQPFYYHDRVVCTLGAMIALTYRGRRVSDKLKIQNGLQALDKITSGATRGLRADSNGATVGFELIVPTLVQEAEKIGIIKQQKDRLLGKLMHLRTTKLAKLTGVKISRKITVAHSAEMAGKDRIDLLDIPNLQEINGSVGNSPSATAYYCLYVDHGNENGLSYLRALTSTRNGGAPTLDPIDIFERVWVIWNLTLAGLHQDQEVYKLIEPHIDYLESQWQTGKGLGFSKSYTPTDSDDTSVGYEILSLFGRNVDIEAILNYEEEDHFRCFHYEATPSIDVNIHVLNTLKKNGYSKNHPTIQKIIRFITSSQIGKSYWIDKWHVSPYYTTSHAIIACHEYAEDICNQAIEWILKTQRANGAWGFYSFPTAEETAYCIQALSIWNKFKQNIPKEKLVIARQWLQYNAEPPYPPLWMDKSLYGTDLLVKSAIVSALAMLEE